MTDTYKKRSIRVLRGDGSSYTRSQKLKKEQPTETWLGDEVRIKFNRTGTCRDSASASLDATRCCSRPGKAKREPLSVSMTTQDIVIAYRQLYQHGLRAVQYAKPQRYTLRDRLRLAFRKASHENFNQTRIDKTLEFLHGAVREKGLEHKILKNILHVWWCQDHPTLVNRSTK